MENIKNIFSQFLKGSQSTAEDADPQVGSAFRQRSINRIIKFGLLIIFSLGLCDIWVGYYIPGIVAALSSLVMITGYWFNKRNFSETRTRNLVIFGYLFIFAYGSFFGQESGMYLFFFPVMIASATFLRYSKPYQMVVFLFLPIVLILIGEVTEYEWLLIEGISPSYLDFKHAFCVGGGMVLMQLYVQFIVTTYNHRKQRLNYSQKNLRTILDNNDNIILLIDRKHKLLDFNSLAIQYFKRTFKQSLANGVDILGFAPNPDMRQQWEERFQKAFRGETVSYIDSFYQEGRQRTYETKFFPVESEQEIERVTVMMSDITAYKQAESKLRQSEQFLQYVIDNIPEGIFWKDENSVYTGCNRHFAQMLGFHSIDEIIGKSDYELLDNPELARHFIDIDQKVMQNRQPFRMIHRSDMLHQPKGDFKFIDSSKVILEQGDKVLGILGTVKDITQLKENEEALKKRNEELIKLNEELDSLIYRVSHDLRAPISSVLGLINVARLEKDADKLESYFKMQEKSLHKLDRFIRDILVYSRNNRQKVELEAIDFRDLSERAFEQHNFSQHAGRITNEITIRQNNVSFFSDSQRLETIFNNLISNAIYYSLPDQRQAFIHVSIDVYEHAAYIRIEDNGQGIAKEHLEKIFNMFYRANERTKGSGLGLYLVKETVRVLGGEVRVESELKAGSVFEVKIPNLNLEYLKKGATCELNASSASESTED